MPNDCPGMLTNPTVPETATQDITIGDHSRAGLSFRSTNMNAGAQDWLQANSVLNPASSAASQRLLMGLNTMPAGSEHVSRRTESGVSTAQVSGLKGRAYISSIKLRRMIRNTPDLETRIKLRELQDRLAKESPNPPESSRESKAAKEQSKSRHREMDRSLRNRNDNDITTDMSKARSLQNYP
jgi:hypothetical protein